MLGVGIHCFIQGVLWFSPVRSALNSTLFDIVREMCCILESVALLALEVTCFFKNKYLDQVSEYKAIRFKDEVVSMSLRTFDLHEQLEDGLSFVLFFKVAYDFVAGGGQVRPHPTQDAVSTLRQPSVRSRILYGLIFRLFTRRVTIWEI